MHRRTKIIITLGPATDDEKVMSKLIDAGIDLVRLNFSHGTMEEHKRRVEMVRRISEEKNYNVGILGDLQGAKLRIGRFVNKKIILKVGDKFNLDAELDLESGNQEVIGFTYKGLINDVSAGDILLLDDGRIALKIEEIDAQIIKTTVLAGGELSSNKGMNRKGGGLSAECITEKDIKDIAYVHELDLDYIAASFIKSVDDIHQVRKLLKKNNSNISIVAKIETIEALENIDDILACTEAIMIARGDLGVEIGDAEVPAVQKMLISKAQKTNCLAITATQMMESMVHSPIPTRAEVSDVANAVLDGTDAVMLSGETAVGEYPIEVVKAMSRICRASEKQEAQRHTRRSHITCDRVDEGIAMATMYLANHLNVAAIAALTESGSTALWMSRISSSIPIYALTRHVKTLRRVTLYKGVFPAPMDFLGKTHAQVNHAAVTVLKNCHEVEDDDLIILTKGDLMGVDGGTNALKVLRVGHMVEEEDDPEHTE
ncbi:MAG: pyruvate kinase [Gammaproteobacteria bacterium]|nr:pyruvate kinase [Gammaproteobacteria bacterium]